MSDGGWRRSPDVITHAHCGTGQTVNVPLSLLDRIVDAVFRRRRSPDPPGPPDPLAAVDPAAVPARYRAPVADALQARAQFAELVGGLRPGPLQDRLHELGDRVDAGVMAVWRTTTQATEVERVVATLDPERVAADLKEARRNQAEPTVVDALTARFTSTQRLLNALDDLRTRLPVVEARLGTAVARAAEIVLTSPAGSADHELSALQGELDTLVVELDTLATATREVGPASA